jgi:hypothetical protein
MPEGGYVFTSIASGAAPLARRAAVTMEGAAEVSTEEPAPPEHEAFLEVERMDPVEAALEAEVAPIQLELQVTTRGGRTARASLKPGDIVQCKAGCAGYFDWSAMHLRYNCKHQLICWTHKGKRVDYCSNCQPLIDIRNNQS